jgi:C_GCAxxG_C_C family probable redox protein
MDNSEIAVARFGQGYSCSQSVFSALAEPRGIALDDALRIAAGFGGGISRTGQTCGCVTGAIMAIGLAQKSVSPEDNKAGKEKTCEAGRGFMRAFEARNGSILCRDLLGCDISTPEGHERARAENLFQLRCKKFVRDAVEIVEGR